MYDWALGIELILSFFLSAEDGMWQLRFLYYLYIKLLDEEEDTYSFNNCVTIVVGI